MSNSNDLSPQDDKPLPIVKKSESGSLLKLVLESHDLGLTPEERAVFEGITRRMVEARPGELRTCSRMCPLHNECPYIVHFEEGRRPYDKRCPIEAELYEREFGNALEYVKSMDPNGDALIPAIELGLCRDLAYYTVLEIRLRQEIALTPEATIDSPVPGAGPGAAVKIENPALASHERVANKKARCQKELYSLVQARLKRVEKKEASKESLLEHARQLAAQMAKQQQNPTDLSSQAAKSIETNKANLEKTMDGQS